MSTPKAGKDLAAFRALHDKSYIVPLKIQEGLKALGENAWEYEVEFIKRCGLSTTDLAAYRDQFKDFFVETGGRNPKRAWAGSKPFAKKLRDNLR